MFSYGRRRMGLRLINLARPVFSVMYFILMGMLLISKSAGRFKVGARNEVAIIFLGHAAPEGSRNK